MRVHVVAVHSRHHHVEEDQIGAEALEDVQPLLAAGRDTDLVALLPEDRGDRLDVGGCVVDEQDAGIHAQDSANPCARAVSSSNASASGKANAWASCKRLQASGGNTG